MKQFNKLAIALTVSLVAGSAIAETPKLYVALGAGQGDLYDFKTSTMNNTDEKDTSWKIAGGAQFNKYLAAELQYHDYGEASGNYRATGDKITTSATTVGISVLPQLPLTEEISIYARLGFVRAGLEFGSSGNGSNWETVNTFGLGLQYNIDEHFAVRGEYEFVRNLGEDSDEPSKPYDREQDADYIGVTGLYKF